MYRAHGSVLAGGFKVTQTACLEENISYFTLIRVGLSKRQEGAERRALRRQRQRQRPWSHFHSSGSVLLMSMWFFWCPHSLVLLSGVFFSFCKRGWK